MRMTIANADDGGFVRVAVAGNVTQAEFGGQTDPLGNLLGGGGYTNRVRLDLAKANYIDSSGIGYLITIHKRFTGAGGELVLCAPPPSVMQVFRLLQMDRVLKIEP
jgi:anti-sigma B factor antagonist